MAPEDNSLEQGYEGSVYDSSLETGAPVTTTTASTSGSGFGHKRLSPFRYNKMAFMVTGVALAAILIIGGGSILLSSLKGNKADQGSVQKADKYAVGSVPLSGVQGNSQLKVGEVNQLDVNGKLQVSETLVITPTTAPVAPTLGQIYFDKATNSPYYYNGTAFVNLAPQHVTSVGGSSGVLNVGGGLSVVNNTINNTGVTSIQGQSGDVNFTSGGGIKVNGTTITNTGILSVSGTPNQVGIINNNGDVQVSLLGLSDGGVVVGQGGGLATIKPTSAGQCLVSDGSNLPVFGSCMGTSTVQSIQVGSSTLSGALVLQATGGLAVSSSGNTITIDGSGIAAGGDVSFGSTHTAGYVTALDTNGDLVSTVLANQNGGLQAATSAYYLDLANAGTSTFTVKNSNGSNVANLVVTGTVQSNGLLDAAGNLYSFDATPSGTSREICYVDNANASNCPAGGNASYGASHNPNTIAALDGSGNIINSNVNVVAGGLQVVSSSYLLDVKDANNSTLTVQNSTSGKAANLVVTGTITAAGLLNGSDVYTLPTNGGAGGVLCYVSGGTSNCPTGGNVSTTGTPTTNQLARFTGSSTIGDSIISDNGSLVTIGGDLSVNAITAQSLQSAGALTISSAGSLTIGSSSQVLALQGNSTSTLVISSSGHTMTIGFTPLTTSDRTINFPNESGVVCLQGSTACGFSAGGSGVTSLNTLTGALTLNNATGSGSAITIDNASTSAKGIASFNAVDFSVASGVVSTIQPIGLTSAVQFGSLTLGTGDLTLAAGNTVHTDNIAAVGSGGLSINAGAGNVTFTTAGGSNSFIFPTYGGTGQMICTIATTCAGGAGSAVILEPGTGTTSQVQTASTDRTAIFINKASGNGNIIQLQSTGNDAFVIDGGGNTTIANTVTATGDVTVSGTLTANTITPNGALTVGSTGQQFTLQGDVNSVMKALDGGFTTSLGYGRAPATSAPTGNVSYKLQNDSTVAPGTYFVCTTAGNCAGVGGGITGSGTSGKLAKFTGTGNIGDSLISDNGTSISIAGNLAVGTSGASQLSIGVASSANGTLVFNNATNVNTITLQAAAAPASNLTLKLPTQSGTFAVGASGPLALDPVTGQLTCATCLTSGGGGGTSGVVSLNGLSGTLNINNATTSGGNTIILDNAAADGTTKGIATFNATNFTASGGVVNLVQDIATTSSPTFANLSLQGATGLTVGSASNLGQVAFKDGTNDGFTSTFRSSTLTANQVLTIPNATGTLAVSASGNLSLSALGNLTISNSPTFSTSVTTPLLQSTGALAITPGGALTVGATGQQFTLQGNGSSVLKATSGANTTTVGFTTPTAARSILFPDAGGTVCLSAPTNNCGFAAGGSGVTSLNGLTGVLTVANATASAGTITLNNAAADGSTKGIAAFNSSNFSDNGSGVINTIQNIGTGASPTFGGLTAGGTITFGGLSTGVLHASSLGVISSSAVQLGTDTTGSYVANLGTLTGLTTSGNSGPGSTPTLSVTYGSSANTAVQGNTTLTCASGTGNLTGGGTSITLGSGGTCGALSLVASPTITGNLVVQGGNMELGVNGTATGVLKLANATGGSAFVSLQADSRSVATTITIPTDPNTLHTTDTVCLQLLGNCAAGAGNFIVNGTAQQTGANYNIAASSGIAAVIQGAASTDIININKSDTTTAFKVGSSGLATANYGLTVTNGATLTGLVQINPSSNSNTTINSGTSTGTFTVGNNSGGAISLQSGTSISIGNNAVAQTLNIGNTTGTTTTSIQGGTGGISLTAATGGAINVTGGAASTITSGSGTLTLQGGNGTGLNNAGASTIINGGQGTGTGVGGDINFQIAKAGSSGSSTNSLSNVLKLSGTDGSALFKNATDSTTAFQVQNAAGAPLLTMNTTGMQITSTGILNVTGLTTPGTPSLTTNSATGGSVPAGTHLYRLVARNPNGHSSASGTRSVTTTGSTSSVTLGWTAVTGATNYYLYRSDDGGTTYGRVSISGGSTITYTDTLLSWGADQSSDFSLNTSSRITLAQGGALYLDSSGNSSLLQDNNSNVVLKAGDDTLSRSIVLQGRSLYFQNTTDYTINNLAINGSGQVTFQNQTDQSDAFQILNKAGTSQLFVADTIHNRVGINLASGADPAVDLEVGGSNGTIRAPIVQGTTNIQIASGTLSNGYFSKSTTIGTGDSSLYDVVIFASDAGNGGAMRAMKTTTARDPRVYGVNMLTGTTTNGNNATIAISGNATVNVTGTVNVGDQLVTSTTAGAVMADNNATTGIVGIALSTPVGGTVSVKLAPVSGQSAPKFQNVSDSTTGFQIQNAAGSSNLFVADTLNGKIGIGMLPVVAGGATLQTVSMNATSYVSSPVFIGSNYNKNYTVGTGGVTTGDVVVLNSSNNVVDTTTARDSRIVGIAVSTVGATATTQVVIGGAYTVNADATVRPIVIGDQLVTSTTSGRVVADNNATTGILGTAISGLASGTGTVNVTVRPISGAISAPHFQNTSDNSLSFQVQNASGSSTIFNIDTANGISSTNSQYYTTGTISQTGTAVTGSGTTFTAGMVGGTLTYSDGASTTITAFTDSTHITVGTSKSYSGTFTLRWGGLNVKTDSSVLLQSTTNSTTALDVRDSGGTSVLVVDTSNRLVGIGGTNAGSKLNVSTSGTTIAIRGLTSSGGTGDLLNLVYGSNVVAKVAAQGATTFQNNADSSAALRVLNQAGKAVGTFDTSLGQFVLGDQSATGITGALVFNTANNANAVTIQSGATSSAYSLTLPTTLGSANQCLTAGGTGSESQLQFQSCTNGAFINGGNTFGTLTNNKAILGTLDSNDLAFYTGGSQRLLIDRSNNMTFTNSSVINVASAGTAQTLTIKGGDATTGTNVGGTLLLQGGAGASTGASGSVIVRSNTNNSTTAFQVQSANSTPVLTVDTTTNLRVTVGNKGTATGQLYVAGNTPSGPLASAGGQAASYGLAINGRYAYITPTGSTKGIQAFDISNPASPTQVGSGVNTTSSSGGKRIKIQGKYAYVAGGGYFQVFDISNPAIPVAMAAGTAYTGGTNTPSLYVQGRYAYVGDSGTPTLTVFDINNPASVQQVTTLAIGSTSNGASDMYAQGRYLYLANGGTNSFQIIDISNPTAPTLVNASAFTATGTALSVVVQGRYAYLGSTTNLNVIDVSTAASPTSVANIALGGHADSLAAQGRYLYAGDATTNGSGVVRTIDISVPASVTTGSILSGTSTGQSPLAMVAAGRYLYTSNNNATANTLQVYDMGGAYTQQLEAGGIETDTLSVRGNANFASEVAIQGSLGVSAGLQVAGNSGFNGSVGIQATNATAFQVKNASGASALTVDTTNMGVGITNGVAYTASSTIGSTLTVGRSPSMSASTITLDSSTTSSATGTRTTPGGTSTVWTIPFTTSGTNKVVVVGVTGNIQSNATGSATVTYAGNAMTAVGSGAFNCYGCGFFGPSTYSQFFYIVVPSATSGNVVATYPSGSESIVVGVAAYSNVDTTSPILTSNTNTGTSTNPNVSLPGASATSLSLGLDSQNGTPSPTTGSGETLLWNAQWNSAPTNLLYGTQKLGASSLSETMSLSQAWAMAGISLRSQGLTVTSAAADISSNCTGSCNDSGSVLKVSQLNSSATGAALTIQNAGSGVDILIGSNTTGQIQTAGGTTTNGINIQSGVATAGTSGAVSFQSGNGTTGTGSLTLQTGNASAGTSGSITIDTGTGTTAAGSINIGTGAYAHNTTVGNLTGASSLTLQGGTGASAITLAAGSGGTIKIGSSGVAGTLTIGNTSGAVTQNISIGANGTVGANSTVTVGSTAGASATAIQGGTGGISLTASGSSNTGTTVKTNTNSTAAFQIQNASGGSLFNIDSANGNITVNASINAQIQSWATATGTGFTARDSAVTIPANGYMFAVGGLISGSGTTSVQSAKISANGDLGNWTTLSGTPLPAARVDAAGVYANGYIYIIGGSTSNSSNNAQDTVYYAKVNNDGTLGSWQTGTSVNVAGSIKRWSWSGFTANGYLYVGGGLNTGGSSTTGLYYSKINADGSIGSWSSTVSLASSTSDASYATANGYVYIMGGAGSTGQYAKLNPNGGVTGTWQSTTLPAGRSGAGIAILNGYLYLVGGANGSTFTGNTFYALLNTSTGALGSWNCQGSSGDCATATQVNTTALSPSRGWFGTTPVVSNGYIYAVGGSTSVSTDTATISYTSTARIQMSGSLDLVGSTTGNGTDASSGGSLTAGNTSILGQLNVAGSANVQQNLTVGGNLATMGDFAIASSSATAFSIGNPASGTALAVDTSTNRVGIGTGPGAHGLDVNATAQFYIGSTGAFIVCASQFCNDGPSGSYAAAMVADTVSKGVFSTYDWAIQSSVNSASAFVINNHAATFNSLQVSTNNLSYGTGMNANAAALKVAQDATTGRSISASGSVNSGGADYAEWIPWSGAKPNKGSLIEYMGNTMVVSSTDTAGFIGNDAITDQDNAILVTFTGQVPVKITGQVHAGDYLVPNGDGTAKGVAPAAASLSDYFGKVGVALADSSTSTVMGLVSGPGANSQFNPQAVSSFTDINVTGTLTTDKLVVTSSAHFKGDIIVEGHIITAGGQLSSQVQSAAGSGAIVTVDGNDTTGTITVTTGSAPQAGDLAKLLFSKVYGKAPHIVISPSNDNAADLRSFKGTTSVNDFMLRAKDIPAANTTYTYDYFIAQ